MQKLVEFLVVWRFRAACDFEESTIFAREDCAWRVMALCSLVYRHTYTKLYGITSQKIVIFIVRAFETPNFTLCAHGWKKVYSKKGEQQDDMRSGLCSG